MGVSRRIGIVQMDPLCRSSMIPEHRPLLHYDGDDAGVIFDGRYTPWV